MVRIYRQAVIPLRLQDRLMGMGYNSVAIHGDMELDRGWNIGWILMRHNRHVLGVSENGGFSHLASNENGQLTRESEVETMKLGRFPKIFRQTHDTNRSCTTFWLARSRTKEKGRCQPLRGTLGCG